MSDAPATIPQLTEQMLAALWSVQGGALLRGPYWTVEGQPLAVIYRGRCDGGAGPDFRDAVIALGDNQPRSGDIELHLHAADWQRHGHDTNPAYNRVILHVTLWPPRPSDPPTRRADGQEVARLALLPYLSVKLHHLPAAVGPYLGRIKKLAEENCWAGAEQLPAAVWGKLLDEAGDARFAEKAANFEAALAAYDPAIDYDAEDYAAQVLYAGLMEGLGYSQNRAPFVRLARAAGVAKLGRLRAGATRPALLESALLGVAGLLPSQRKARQADWPGEEYGAELEQQWLAAARMLDLSQAMHEGEADGWVWAKVRPANYPTRRVAAAAALLDRFADKGLLAELREAVMHDRLADGLSVSAADSYWATHADFGVSVGGAGQDLLGASRAADLAVNVVLPFFHAYADLHDDDRLRNLAHHRYVLHPRLADNEVTRRMGHELLGERKRERGLLNGARRQQGLMHLYRRYCGERRCAGCPVASSISEL